MPPCSAALPADMLLPMPGLRSAGAAAAAEAAAAEAEAAAGGAGLGVALDELGRDANMERRREAAERSARRRGRLQRDLERLQRQGQARRRPALTPTLTHPNLFPAVLRGRLQRDLERLQRQGQARWGGHPPGPLPAAPPRPAAGAPAAPPLEPDLARGCPAAAVACAAGTSATARRAGCGWGASAWPWSPARPGAPTHTLHCCVSKLPGTADSSVLSKHKGCDLKYPGHCRTARRRCWARRRRTSPIRRSAATRASGATWSRPRGPCLRTPATSSARCARSRRAPAAARAAPGVRQPAGGGQASRS